MLSSRLFYNALIGSTALVAVGAPIMPRGYVFDMDRLTILDGPFPVAHGRGSSSSRAGVPTRFSNAFGSNASSLGLYVTQQTYAFVGHSGGTAYHSMGLALKGVSGSYN